ncbi:MAG: type IV pilin-like G/H family protein [Thermosynechococcaceae cyanobacterium]
MSGFSVVVQADPKKSTIATATPIKPNLKSYTGFVFLLNPTGDEVVTGVCETDRPSPTPPTPPSAPSAASEPVQCPLGSSLVN